ncbi:MAG: cytochrome c [Gammaproteobacteria bacterium]|nr:MAG: cytochrome c [Gammaproteobacteria bacterium]
MDKIINPAPFYLLLSVCCCQVLAQAPEQPQTYGIGRTATAAEIAAWDIDIKPDGKALPPGSGTVAEGEAIYVAQCAVCHGKEGGGGPNDRLVVHSAEEPFPDASNEDTWRHRTIGNYWPYATTVFDYIRRSMPMNLPGSLQADEVYALTAYLLHLNHIVPADAELDANTLAQVEMPARHRFVPDDRHKYREVH